MCACLISDAQNYVNKFLATQLGTSLSLVYSLQKKKDLNNLSIATRKNMIIVVASRSNKATDSSRTVAKSQTIQFESSYLNPCVMTLILTTSPS